MSNFVLKGQWFGEAHTQERCFKGSVEDAGGTGMQHGDAVTVRFAGGQHTQHGHDSARHGSYVLTGMPEDRHFTLVSFVRKDGGTDAEAEYTDAEQLWGGDLFTT